MTPRPAPAEGELERMLAELESTLLDRHYGHTHICFHPYWLEQFLAAVRARLKEDEETIADLRSQENRYFLALLRLTVALKDCPELPEPQVLKALSHIGQWPEDWEQGKRMQREHDLEKIPPKTEYELGAGVWHRLRARLAPPVLHPKEARKG